MEPNRTEIESVLSLDPFKRYKYFIKKVADFEKMYSLTNTEGNWALSEIEGKVLIPFWPANAYAEFCISDWKGSNVKEIDLNEFQDEMIDLIESKNWLINIFPKEGLTGFIVDLDEFVRDLSNELKNYE